MTAPWVGVVVLNWNTRDETLACVASLLRTRYENLDVIIVDNGSTDGSAAAFRSAYPDLCVVETGENLGFSGGNNVGLQLALRRGCDSALILNSDTLVTDPDWLTKLVAVGEADPTIGISGPLTFDATGEVCGGPVIVDWKRGRVERYAPIEGGVVRCDMVGGHALLVKREVLERVGLLDDRLFLFYEETDLCRRAKDAGYSVALVADAALVHEIGKSRRSIPYTSIYYSHRNRLLFLRKHGTAVDFALAVLQDVVQGGVGMLAARMGREGFTLPWLRTESLADDSVAASTTAVEDAGRLRRVKLAAWIDGLVGNYGRREIPS